MLSVGASNEIIDPIGVPIPPRNVDCVVEVAIILETSKYPETVRFRAEKEASMVEVAVVEVALNDCHWGFIPSTSLKVCVSVIESMSRVVFWPVETAKLWGSAVRPFKVAIPAPPPVPAQLPEGSKKQPEVKTIPLAKVEVPEVRVVVAVPRAETEIPVVEA